MTRAVLDANALVSGIVGRYIQSSTVGEVLRRWLDGQYSLFVSQHILRETRGSLLKPYFTDRVPADVLEEGLSLIQELALYVAVTATVTGVATHPEDDLILATAVSASADVLVSGDRQLLKLGTFEGVRILSPRDFLDYLDAQPHDTPSPAPQPSPALRSQQSARHSSLD